MSELAHAALTALSVAAALGWLLHHFTRRTSSGPRTGCASCPAARAPAAAMARRGDAHEGPPSIRLPVIG